jgi:biotin carboxylase
MITMTEPSPSSTTTATKPNLRGVSAIRAYFRRNTTPIYFVSPTPFNLLGVDRWISNFHYVNYYDSFDGTHPHVFLPRERGVDDFGSMEEMNNYLLGHPEFAEFAAEQGPGGKAVLVMVDDTTERLAAERGIDVALPPAALRHRLDSKLVTTRLGNEAGVASVPNVLGSVADYESLLDLAAHGGLGTDLVVQLPWGDSGKTTFFVNSRESWDRAAAEHELTGVELKVMKRINCRPLAVEAVLTRHGTLVGPLMSDITGHPELTPYKGGWAGNDV